MSNSAPSSHFLQSRPALLAFCGAIAIVAVAAYILSADFPRGAKLFPQTVSVIVFIVAIIAGIAELRRKPRDAAEAEEVETADLTSDTTLSEVWPYLMWILGTYVAMFLIGFVPASALFCVLFLWRVARAGWLQILAMTALCLSTMVALGIGLNISWPQGILRALLG